MSASSPPAASYYDVRLEAGECLLDDLRQRCGLKRDDLLERKVAGLIRQRPQATLFSWLDDLRDRPANQAEWLAIVDAVTIHETYFFRDPNQLEVLRQVLLPEQIAACIAADQRRITVWSAGCASGEEAYSVAILLLEALGDAGENPSDWHLDVLGTDVSAVMVDVARAAVYGGPGLDSFRQLPPEHGSSFVPDRASKKRRGVHRDVRALVRFEQHNLVDSLPPVTAVDIALCRNVFIYLDGSAQERAVGLLRTALRPGGDLLLGVTDRLPVGCG
ncbi:MAG: protein-glutamate O-methyltransferase CheR, partial [Rhodospirillaceae bacterium]|nr:protein-glutamate O-methyltransferase CheR [Rhodospirillaceae bacterium]